MILSLVWAGGGGVLAAGFGIALSLLCHKSRVAPKIGTPPMSKSLPARVYCVRHRRRRCAFCAAFSKHAAVIRQWRISKPEISYSVRHFAPCGGGMACEMRRLICDSSANVGPDVHPRASISGIPAAHRQSPAAGGNVRSA